MTIPPFVRVAVKRLLILMLAYSATRLMFLIWNFGLYRGDVAGGGVFLAFFHGLKFDLAAILFTNLALLLIWMLPARWLALRWVALLDRLCFIAINTFFIGVNFADVEYSRFIGKRMSFEYFSLHQDIERQSPGVITEYWQLVLILLALLVATFWFYPKFSKTKSEGWIGGLVWRLVVVGLTVLGMRGGFSLKPMHPMDAYFAPQPELGLLALNTPFNVLKTRPDGKIITEKFFSSQRDVIARVKMLTQPSRPPLGILKGYNVVVILIESFSTEDMGAANSYPGYLPFMDQLAKKSYFFKYNFANSRRSVEGVGAVFCGIPALTGQSIIMSDFVHNRMDCLPRILGELGYSTYFIHGAYNGSMHFDSFSPLAGFQHFMGFNEFPDKTPETVDPTWGVADEPMLQYAVKIIDQAKKPMFMGFFTLSSHTPFFIPPHLRGRFPKGENEIDASMGYTDYSLRKFFEAAQTKPWFNHTIFVFTGDHVHPTKRPEYMDQLGRYRVPLMFYIPGLKKRLDVSPDRITQHIDVLPSILDLLGIQRKTRFLLGQSVFDSGVPGRAYNYLVDFGYWMVDPDKFVLYNLRNHEAQFARHDHTWNLKYYKVSALESKDGPDVKDLLSIAQYFNVGLVNNSFYDYDDKTMTAKVR